MTTKATKQTQCHGCGTTGKRVGTTTMRAMLNDELAAGIDWDQNDSCANGCKSVSADTGWRFCDSPDCDVVYFSEEGDTTFTKSQLKVAVGVKETSGERPLCYCFDHSVASIKEELRTKGHSDALEDIRAKMKDPGCRCEAENPSGSCCLGSVGKGIKIAQEELEMSDTAIQTLPTPAKPSGNKGEKIAKVGTIISAIMASSCCWLPLVLLAVGVSGAGIASTLEAYRPYFMVVTFGFLGMAFYFTYRPQRGTSKEAGGCCETVTIQQGDCCATATKRFTMLTFNKAMLWVVTLLAIAFLFFPNYVGAFLGNGDDTNVTEDMNRAVIKIDGMTCEGCAALVAAAIRKVPGVLAVEVDYKSGEAVVGTEICCPIPKKEILAALQGAGYEGRFASPSDKQANTAVPTRQISPPLIDLSQDAAEFKDAFDDAKGKVRIVMLVSPG